MGDDSIHDRGADTLRESTSETASDESAHGPPANGKPPVSTSRRLRRMLSNYASSAALLAVGCALLIAAIALFPGDGPVAPSGAVLQNVDIVGDFAPLGIFVKLSHRDRPVGTQVDVGLYSRQPQSSNARVILSYLGDAQGSPLCGTCVRLGGGIEDILSMSNEGLVNAGPFHGYGEEAETLLRGVPFNFASNSVYAAATLPDVRYVRSAHVPVTGAQLLGSTGRPVFVTTVIDLDVGRSTHYAWTGSPPPGRLGGDIVWDFVSPISGTAGSPSGVSLSGQDRDTKATFVAGALLGIAGGALVGALQEAIGSARRRRNRPETPSVRAT